MKNLMRRILAFTSLSLAVACTIQQQNGNQITLQPPPFMRDQSWKAAPDACNHPRACVISNGEVRVTLMKQSPQVATALSMAPGDFYKIIVKNHSYETSGGVFSPADSAAIIADFLANKVAYTELHEIVLFGNAARRSQDNTIPLNNFGAEYRICKDFISKKPKTDSNENCPAR